MSNTCFPFAKWCRRQPFISVYQILKSSSCGRRAWRTSHIQRLYSSLQSSPVTGFWYNSISDGVSQRSSIQPRFSQPTRSFYRMLNAVFNRPDKNRIKEVGVERACAEWLLRCGAHIRWKDGERWHKDYNSLPPVSGARRMQIEEIDADEAAVMDIGFSHLEGLSAVRRFRFNHCPYLEDSAISQLILIKETLEHVEITSCGDITDQGLMSLTQLMNLKTLKLRDLPEVKNKEACLKTLRTALPHCEIDFVDAGR